MTDFYVSWMKPIKRARIHKADCRNCNDGRGQLGQDKTGSGNTGWIEATTMERALEIASDFKRKGFTDVEFCGTCLRSKRT